MRPMPEDERLCGNQTTSLCDRESWREFRVVFHALAETAPALVLVATDGYANSFRDDAGFLQVGTDLLLILRTDGLEAVKKDLESWLTETSQEGSGDDITLGVLYRQGTIPPVQHTEASEENTQIPAS
jgi:hypothetical protein